MSSLFEKSKFTQAQFSEKITNGLNYINARAVPPLTHAEAEQMALVELNKFVRLLGSLDENDWDKPTACILWSVRQIVAHLAGWMVAFTSLAALRHSIDNKLLKPYRQDGLNLLDAMNQLQVDERANSTPAELIAELAEAGAVAISNRARLPLLLRAIPARIPTLGWVRLDYVTDLIGVAEKLVKFRAVSNRPSSMLSP